MIGYQTRQRRRSLEPHSILRVIGGTLLAGLVAGCVAPAGSSASPETVESPVSTPGPTASVPHATPESTDAQTTEAADTPDAQLARMTWVARDPDTGAWILGVGADAGWRVALGDDGHARPDFGWFATISTNQNPPSVGIGDPSNDKLVDTPSPFDDPPSDARVDRSGRWLFLHAGADGLDQGVVALDPRTGDERVLVAPSKVDTTYARNSLLWSPTGDTLVSTLCDLEQCLVDVIDVASMTSKRLDKPFPAVAATDQYLVGHGPEGDAWRAFDLDTGTIITLPVDPVAQVWTVLAVDDTTAVLDTFVGRTYSIVAIDLATGESRTVHSETVADEGAPAMQLVKPSARSMTQPAEGSLFVPVASSNSFSVAMAEAGTWPVVQLLDLASGELASAKLVIEP